ncbi:tRNA pseudouridine synthase 4 [Trichomonascus vanleenenianus]|uniref:pseudouridine synthase PUS4 n=1 Tax=Trichomonascus vanleenenianus TaxID=2268995 RepID=UPI003ECB426A
MSKQLMNGVFAVNKPSGPSSGDVVSDLKHYFSKSPVFKGDIDALKKATTARKSKKIKYIKIGHGGTLDPLASGVLVIGIGSGTKQLTSYLGQCKKTYVAEALFGWSTTTYDSQGKRLKQGPIDHLTDEAVKAAIGKFRGTIEQTPPVFSALKMNGKPLYEYARSGEALPKEIQPREVQIDELEIVGSGLQWDHSYEAPAEEADDKEKEYSNILNKLGKEENSAPKVPESVEWTEPKPPVLKIRFTVSSGTYIRSLIHDIGLALGTTAHMVSLVRERQADWVLGDNVFEVDDFLKRDSDQWEPELRQVLVNGPKTTIAKIRVSEEKAGEEKMAEEKSEEKVDSTNQ